MMSGVRASSIRIEFDLVDDGERVAALDHLRELVLHVVAQIVEAEFVVGAVGNVAGIGRLALVVVEPVHDDADRKPEELVDAAHPFGVAPGEVVVDGDDVHALAGKRVEIDRQRRDERLAFAGLHLGDGAFVQHHAADQLHVEMPLPEGALGRLAHRREGFDEEIVEITAVGELLAELGGAGAQRLVAELRHLRLDCVDGRHFGRIGTEPPVVYRAERFSSPENRTARTSRAFQD